MEIINYQITSIAGEFLTVGKLFKRGMQASLTPGNAKGFNLAERQITRYLDNLPDPDEIAVEIIENLEAGLESFSGIMALLNGN